MLWRDNIYTVHEKEGAPEPTERIVLVREGFSLWAFAFTVLWLLSHRLWLMSAFYFLLVILLVKASIFFHFHSATMGILQFGLQLWLGMHAHDAQRAALARQGYVLKGVVCAESQLLAERRYYDRLYPAS